jgi:hypothetical protein
VRRSTGQISTLAAGQATEGFSTTIGDIIEVLESQTKLRFCDLKKRASAPSLSKRHRKDPWTRVRWRPIGLLAIQIAKKGCWVAPREARFHRTYTVGA